MSNNSLIAEIIARCSLYDALSPQCQYGQRNFVCLALRGAGNIGKNEVCRLTYVPVVPLRCFLNYSKFFCKYSRYQG